MEFKEKFKKTLANTKEKFQEEAEFRAKVRAKEREAKREAKLKYAPKRAEAREEARYKSYKQSLNKPQSSGFGGSNFFDMSSRASSAPPKPYSPPSYFAGGQDPFGSMGRSYTKKVVERKKKVKRKPKKGKGKRIVIYT